MVGTIATQKLTACSGFLITRNYILTAAHRVWSQALEHLGPVYDDDFLVV